MWSYPVASGSDIKEPVTLDAAKAQCNVDFDDDNDLLTGLIAAGRDHVEKYCGINFASQTLSAFCETFRSMADLPFSPVQEIVSITYVDPDGEQQRLDGNIYKLQTDPYHTSLILRQGYRWPDMQAGSSIQLVAKVGFDSVPDAVRHAVLLFISDAYKTREPSAVVPLSSFDALLCNYRRHW